VLYASKAVGMLFMQVCTLVHVLWHV